MAHANGTESLRSTRETGCRGAVHRLSRNDRGRGAAEPVDPHGFRERHTVARMRTLPRSMVAAAQTEETTCERHRLGPWKTSRQLLKRMQVECPGRYPVKLCALLCRVTDGVQQGLQRRFGLFPALSRGAGRLPGDFRTVHCLFPSRRCRVACRFAGASCPSGRPAGFPSSGPVRQRPSAANRARPRSSARRWRAVRPQARSSGPGSRPPAPGPGRRPRVPAAGSEDDHHAKLAARLRYAPPTTQLGRETANALTFDLDQSTGAGQIHPPASPILQEAHRILIERLTNKRGKAAETLPFRTPNAT